MKRWTIFKKIEKLDNISLPYIPFESKRELERKTQILLDSGYFFPKN